LVYKTLLDFYGPRNWWPAKTTFEMMVGAIFTQNTAWTNVEKAIANFGERLSPEFIETVSQEELGEIIRPSGYYNQKAIYLKALTAWLKKYSYDLNKVMKNQGEALRRELLSVKGVGRETADSILTYALEKPFFIVDAYTKRVLARLGYELPSTYDGIRLLIEGKLPRDLDLYNEFHALIVEQAKSFCQKKPLCEGCPLGSFCVKKASQNSRKEALARGKK
ncbi:MAG: endonuclease III domain-containing protein, partial [Desulfitobacteriaceae bacterium]|nr:endonuclease III domain-containing protein [Desulfitobacteriaceae bacterium]